MTKTKSLFPEIKRPLEYVAFLNFKVPTKEGPGFVFMACDGFSELGFQIGVEPNESAESVLKSIYLLTEHKDFVRHIDKGFTLVFDRFEELSERIEAIVKPLYGKILFDKGFHKKIAAPLLDGFSPFL